MNCAGGAARHRGQKPDEIKTRLGSEKARKTALTTDLARLERLAKIATVKVDQVASQLRTRISDVAGLLGRQTVQARQMLRKILADKIELEPVGSGRQRGVTTTKRPSRLRAAADY